MHFLSVFLPKFTMTDAPKLSFGGLKMSFKPAKKVARGSAFSLEADEEPIPSTSNLSQNSTKGKGGSGLSTASLSRAQKAQQKVDLELDGSVYEYDEVYDNMKEGGRLAAVEKKKDAGERKVSRLPARPLSNEFDGD